MTANKFIVECDKRLILSHIALENDQILQALLAKNDTLVLELLDTEF